MKRLPALVVFALAAAPVYAQPGSDSWNTLRASGAVKVGDTIHVTDAGGRKTTGRIQDLSDTSLVLLTENDGQQTLTPSGVSRIQRHDSVANGLLMGLGGGLAAAYIAVGSLCSSPDPECETIVNLAIGVPAVVGGTVLGGVTDALIRKTVYVGPTAGRTRIGLTPILSKDRNGVAFSLGF